MDKEYKPKIIVATPMYGGMCTGEYTRSMMHVPVQLTSNGVSVAFQFVMNNSLIQSARNQLADIFMKDEEATHLMFIDADIGFEAKDILYMLGANVDIIAGVYPRKKIAWNKVKDAVEQGIPEDRLEEFTGDMVVHMLNGTIQQEVKATEPFEVKAVGTGFVLIKRSVFERIQNTVGTYLDDNLDPVYEYFQVIKHPQTNRQMSEDYSFCYFCSEAGIKIHIAPWVALTHTGTYRFSGSPIRIYKDAK